MTDRDDNQDNQDNREARAPRDAVFKTTQWSLVLVAATAPSPEADAALETLCRTYWPPVYAFIRRQGALHRQVVNPDDARELTQEFFAEFLEKKKFSMADPARGRFRSFLIASLKNFLTGEWRREQAKKRGGDRWILSLDEQRETESRFFVEPADPSLTPDRAFEREFALTLLDKVMEQLRREFVEAGEAEKFEAMKEFLWSGRARVSQGEAAARLGVRPGTFSSFVFRGKRRFGALLRAEIAQVVDDPSTVDDELHYLMEALGN